MAYEILSSFWSKEVCFLSLCRYSWFLVPYFFENLYLGELFISFIVRVYHESLPVFMFLLLSTFGFEGETWDLFLFSHERNFMVSHSHNEEAGIIHASYSTSRYLDDLLNTDSPYFEGMLGQIYPAFPAS